jgi:hypothetical protein
MLYGCHIGPAIAVTHTDRRKRRVLPHAMNVRKVRRSVLCTFNCQQGWVMAQLTQDFSEQPATCEMFVSAFLHHECGHLISMGKRHLFD